MASGDVTAKSQKDLDELLGAVSYDPGSFSEYDLQARIQALVRKASDSGETPPPELVAESVAFAFVEDYPNEHWGTYYGPMFILPNDQGQMVEHPGIQSLSTADLEYWTMRARQESHPCLKLRYADLVWDFSEKVSGTRPDYTLAHVVIDATIEIAARRLEKYGVSTIKKLRRALDLALSLNDSARVAAVCEASIAFEDLIGQDLLPGTWGFSFDMLLSKKNIPPESEHGEHILESLEGRLKRIDEVGSPGTSEIVASEAAAIRLDRYYASHSRPADSRRVLQAHANLVTKATGALEPLVAHHWLQQLFALLSSRGMKDEADALTQLIGAAGENTVRSLKEISHEVSIPREEIEAYFDSFCTGSDHDALCRLAGHFVPDPEHIERQVKDLAQKAPLQSLITHTILDASGRPVAKIGPVESDLEGRVVNQTSRNLQIEALFLRGAIDRVKTHFGLQADDLLRFLLRSPVFPPKSEPSLRAGLVAYVDGNYISAICILIPQIEAAIRTLAGLIHAPVFRPGRHGGLAFRSLDELLRDEAITTFLGSPTTSYLQILSTDQRGWNLRNDVAHGLVPGSHLGPVQADRVIHTLLLLSMVEEKEPPKD